MEGAGIEKVAFWGLEPYNAEQASDLPDQVEPCILGSGVTDIGIFPKDDDVRIPVNKEDVNPGGKYHSIVKLFIRNQPSGNWTTATGWLCRDDLVVTAAHCVLKGNQHAACIRVCIGYSASSNGTGASSDNQRSVVRIALPSAWSDSCASPSNMAFLQLDKPFEDVTPIKYSTPGTKVQEPLTVVGYASDIGARAGSPGGEMYRMKICREIDLDTSRWNMLVYQGDSMGGFGGAPIIRDSDFVAIGVHARGGSFNFGTVIGGSFGVNVSVYEEALRILGEGNQPSDVKVDTDPDREWLKYTYIACE
ncbi:hypothetical protein BB8028_0001g05860 [Beauveria bassiana]|uniref:Serine protease n=1 Tax=Beauveria bassiana TaxID=176275 RepID=A0A2S7XXZ3_BEABA|nr:hypothetical protein BB8028_0001g05860 [Beauveria bassiana]